MEHEAKSPLERGGRRPGCVIVEINKDNLNAFLNDIKKVDIFACKATDSGLMFSTEKNNYFLDPDKSGESWKSVFYDKTKTLIGHDLKQLIKSLNNLELGTWNLELFDTMLASYILNSSTRSHDLPSIVMRELGVSLPSSSDQTSLFEASQETLAQELQYCLQLYPKMKKQLEEIDDQGLFEKIGRASCRERV